MDEARIRAGGLAVLVGSAAGGLALNLAPTPPTGNRPRHGHLRRSAGPEIGHGASLDLSAWRMSRFISKYGRATSVMLPR